MLPETVVSSRWSAAPAELVRPPPDADLLLVTVTVSSVVVPEFVSAPPEALLAVPLVSVSWEKVAVEAAATLISCRRAADLGPSITVAPGPAPVTTTALAVTGERSQAQDVRPGRDDGGDRPRRGRVRCLDPGP